LSRHVYQSSGGGHIYCPLEVDARIIQSATPHFARQLSSKYSEMSASQVQKDLSRNHGRKVSSDYIQKVSGEVGDLIERKEKEWTYSLPSEVVDSELVSIGRDGTTMPIRGKGYRETMNGTISFYDKTGIRIHTIYLACAPEYGKSKFNSRFTEEINNVKTQLSNQSHYIGLADGAKENWTFLEQHVQTSILDYWHVCEYLSKASKAFSKSKKAQKNWAKQARKKLKNNKTGSRFLLKEMRGFLKKKLSAKVREELQQAITYFVNHLHQMSYKEQINLNHPIGSGVTEAACKVIVKQRTNQSGMRWNIDTAQKVLNIRALYRTNGRWIQFWDKVDQVGIVV